VWHSVKMSPAKLSSLLGSLFPPGVRVAESREPGDTNLLLPAETKYLGKSVPKRAQEFAAGRVCARLVLAEFGIRDFPIEMAEDRQPIWPESVVGSITHTAGFCAAAVAEKAQVAAIGMDCEVAGSVKAELWPAICVPLEILWLHSLPEGEQAIAATLLFSAKEAFYKCQYPLARERLNFHDVSVEVPAWDAHRGAFSIHPSRSIAFDKFAALPLPGQYLFHEALISAGIAMRR
jgi:4'-phosphopantetheinyl transferase EntD